MKTELHGKFVYMDDNELDLRPAFDLVCRCGHKLVDHACPYSSSLRMFTMSHCTKCKLDCERFYLEEDLK